MAFLDGIFGSTSAAPAPAPAAAAPVSVSRHPCLQLFFI